MYCEIECGIVVRRVHNLALESLGPGDTERALGNHISYTSHELIHKEHTGIVRLPTAEMRILQKCVSVPASLLLVVTDQMLFSASHSAATASVSSLMFASKRYRLAVS